MIKRVNILLVLVLLSSCKKVTIDESNYTVIGEKMDAKNIVEAEKVTTQFASLNIGDTINSKIKATIKEVCPVKGCWMTLDIGNDEEMMVRFKDYGFFMPLNAEGDVVINGKMFVEEMSVEDQKHYAEDAGKTEEEILAINQPKKVYAFEANGVLLNKDY